MASAPPPTVMPVDRQEWAKQLHLSNFINTYYQYRDLSLCNAGKRLLIVGPGQGLDAEVLRWRGYDVTTFDIDETFKPDVLGSVHAMSMFREQQFDAAVASHVLEHLAVPFLDKALAELARVARYVLVYLPVAGRHVQVRLLPGFLGIDWSFTVDLYNWFHRPSGTAARYCQRQHYWEVGYRGFHVRQLRRRFRPYFDIVRVYRNRDWTPSCNFVLRSKHR